MTEQRTDETLREFLGRRERELLDSVAMLKAQIEPLETELAEIRRSKSALRSPDEVAATAAIESGKKAAEIEKRFAMYRDVGQRLRNSKVHSLKIKDLIVRAFLDQFADGATPAEIGRYILAAYNREVDPGSIRPNLARLRKDGILMPDIGRRWVRVPQAAIAIMAHYSGDGRDGFLLALAGELAWREEPG